MFLLLLCLLRLRRVFQFFGRHMGMDLAPEDGATDEELFGDEAFQRLLDRLMRQAGMYDAIDGRS